MKSDFYTAIAQIAAERGIPKEAVLSSVEHALKTVYKKMANTEEDVTVEIDRPRRGHRACFVIKQVVDEIEDPLNDMLLPEAQTIRAERPGRRRDPRSSAHPRTSAGSPRRRPSKSSCSGSATTSATRSTRSTTISRARCSTASSSAPIHARSSSSWARPRR